MAITWVLICSLFPAFDNKFCAATVVSSGEKPKGSKVVMLIFLIILPSNELYGFCINFLYSFFAGSLFFKITATGLNISRYINLVNLLRLEYVSIFA